MFNVSGRLLSTAEIESALVEHNAVTEAAVVSHLHPVKGKCAYCFVTFKEGDEFADDLLKEQKEMVRNMIGHLLSRTTFRMDQVYQEHAQEKSFEEFLRKIAVGSRDIGDVTTLADESLVEVLFELRPKDD